ncbi:MAG: sodium-dependent transporter [Kiritimatiellales bacterium]
MPDKRSLWGSKIGFLLAAIGSAIGLGNIWRFSYMSFQYGGGAFLIPYFAALLLAGIPLMILEYTIGHRERASSPLAFARIAPRWEWIGWWMPTVALFGIMLYYSAVIGWCINYLFFSANMAWGSDPQGFFFGLFLQVSDGPFQLGGIRWPILATTLLGWGLCWIICFREISHGIEKACMVFMPLLFILTLVLVGWTLTLDGAWEAIRSNYLTPDWNKINIFKNPSAWGVWAAAFGQIFFTLSLGFGIMITYASYLPSKTDITGNALWTCAINCLYSFIAGFAVFGIVGFMASASGAEFSDVIKSGPQLAFVVYPEAIRQLPVGSALFGILFFLVLLVAGLSSGISLIEAFTCALIDKFNCSRRKTVTVVCLLGFAGSLVFTTRAGLLVLDILDHFVTNYGLIAGGILECLLVGWLLKARTARDYVNGLGGLRLSPIWDLCVCWLTPAILLVIFGQTLWSDLRHAYGGYTPAALILFGVCWMAVILTAAFILKRYAWPPDKLQHDHTPNEETLLT